MSSSQSSHVSTGSREGARSVHQKSTGWLQKKLSTSGLVAQGTISEFSGEGLSMQRVLYG